MWLNNFKTKHHNWYILTVAFLFAFFTLLSCSVITSFIYPQISTIAYYNDGAMFHILGASMAKGYTPYIEVFDHKGLYLFYYTMIGAGLGKYGIFLIQLILMTVAYFFIYKAIELHSKKTSILLIAFFLFTIFYAFSGQTPNDSDLELPFNAIMIYFYLKGMKNDDDRSFLYGNIAAGISAGIAINLRMSDALLPFAFTVYFLVRSIMKKQTKNLFINAGIVVGAMLAMSVPPFIHAIAGGFLNDMVDAVYLNNFKYITTTGQRDDGLPIIAYIAVPLIFVIYFLLIYFKRNMYKKDFIIFNAVTIGVVGVIELVIAFYPHYFIVLYPYLAISLTILLIPYLEHEEGETKLARPASLACLVVALASLAFNPVLYGVNRNTDIRNINFINNIISEEAKNGHTLIFGSPALYLTNDIKIGYGDFSCQDNHILFSERYSEANLAKYLASDDSMYLITNAGHVKQAEDLFTKYGLTTSYEKLYSPVGVTITIYEHII